MQVQKKTDDEILSESRALDEMFRCAGWRILQEELRKRLTLYASKGMDINTPDEETKRLKQSILALTQFFSSLEQLAKDGELLQKRTQIQQEMPHAKFRRGSQA